MIFEICLNSIKCLQVALNIRQQIIVYSPYNKFKPSEEEMKGLEVSGIKKPIKVVENLPPSYYEPYEHA